ncbi:YVTN family beta-propeller repeat protein [Salisediminibacterium beveridgei]|uniref:YVTN Beta-Propeller Repeat-Containing Protein n=1 Tax=Salisediminibacterium beveridgei TaxID=632773 RepID=A0A1D7QXT6_9BACI|nr:beta-propeller fold lactonase family protein [Salisediminibacterium beveridgei]AOM83778.1 YVTN Beta-Propeller Repeat-Containing Protein [Salisediminibacterium beveridgei]
MNRIGIKKLLMTGALITLATGCALEDGENSNNNEGASAGDAGELTNVQFYVPSEEEDLVSIIDVVSGDHVGDIDVGQRPTIVTFASTMREAFVANQDSSTVSIVNTQSLEETAEIDVGPRPHGLALSSNNNTLYVATVGDQYLDVVDVESEDVTSQIDLGHDAKSNYVYLNEDTLYVTDHENDVIYVVDAESEEVTDTFETGELPRVVRVYDETLYVASGESGLLEIIDLDSGDSSSIDTGHGATDVIVTEDGHYGIVTSIEGDKVVKVDLEQGSVVAEIDGQEGAKHLAFNREESRAYVTLSESNEVSVIDVDSFEEEYRIEIGGDMPHGIDIKALPGIGGSC